MMRTMAIKYLMVFALFSFTSACYALPFTIAPKVSLPTTITPGSTVTAYYTVTNNTLTQRNNNFVKYLPPDVTQVTSGGTYGDTCGGTFNLAANGSAGDSCTLQLTITAPVVLSNKPNKNLFVCFPGGMTCAGTAYPLNISQSTNKTLTSIAVTPTGATLTLSNTKQFTATGTYSDNTTADLTSSAIWVSSNTSIATVSSSGLATPLSAGQSFIHAIYNGVTSNSVTLNSAAYAYITDSGTSHISYCVINNNGTLSACATTGSGFNTPQGIALNPAKSYIYVTNSGNNTISYCTVNTNGTLSNCNSTGSGFNSPSDIAFNPAGSLACITNYGADSISYCTVNSNGQLSSCNNAGGSFFAPLSLAITPSGSGVYVVNSGSGGILYCPINSNGTFGTCTTEIYSANATGISINATGTRVYFAGAGNSYTTCLINNDHTLTGCSGEGGAGFSDPRGSAITDFYAYTANLTSTQVGYCSLNNDGTLNPFSTTASGLSLPMGIAI